MSISGTSLLHPLYTALWELQPKNTETMAKDEHQANPREAREGQPQPPIIACALGETEFVEAA